MSIIVFGSARSNEKGGASGGVPGDQKQVSGTNDTKGEVSMCAFYMHTLGWLVFNWINNAYAEAAALQMKYACNNMNIGYCQAHKTTLFIYVKEHKIKSLDKVDKPCETDCSTLIRVIIYIVTGIDIGDITTAPKSEPVKLAASGLFEASYEYTSQDKTPVYNGSILVTKSKGHTGIVVSGNPRRDAGDKAEADAEEKAEAAASYSVGDVISFIGSKHYTSSSAASGKTCKPGTAKVTNVYAKGKHPYHLQAVTGGGSTVYGWVDATDIEGTTSSASASASSSESFAIGDKVKVTGTIYGTGNGTGGSIKKSGAIMYISDIANSKTYPYYIGVAAKKGGTRIGWAKPDIVKKQ
jgi:hypothetical protein